MALLSKDITLSHNGKVLTGLQEIPDLGGTSEAVDVTTLSDEGFVYIDGIKNYGDSLDFIFVYDAVQFNELVGDTEVGEWVVTLKDGETCSFSGTHSVKLNGVGVNAAIQYTLSIKPRTAMAWDAPNA